MDNAGESTISGLELELTALLSERLTVWANLGYTDAEYDEYLSLAPDGSTIDLSDRELRGVPEYNGRLAAEYRLPVSEAGELAFLLAYDYLDEYFGDPGNAEFSKSDPLNIIDAIITFRAKSGAYTVELWGKNLTDDVSEFAFGYEVPPLFNFGYPSGPPRTYGISLNWDL